MTRTSGFLTGPGPGPGRRGRNLAACWLAAALVLTACGARPAAPAPGTGSGTAPAPTAPSGPTSFRIAIGIDPDTLDPAGQTTTTASNIVDYVCETLVKMDKDGNIKPGLADSWQVGSDGLSVTFKLHPGVKFQDGTAFDATAAKFSLDRLLHPPEGLKTPQGGIYQKAIKSVDAVDPGTIKLTLNAPAPWLVAAMAATTVAIISPASVKAEGNTETSYTHPVGTGPYIFKDRVKGSKITLEKFKDYWSEKPFFDSVVINVVPEAATRETMIRAGQVDMMILPNIPDIPSLQSDPNLKVLMAPSDRTIFIALDTRAPELKDKRVRQAFNYAVNRQDIIKNVLFGAGQELDAPMSSTLFGYCKTGPYEYNPDKARQLLQEANATNLNLKFISPTGRYVQDYQAAQAISGYLQKVGVTASLSTMDWPSYIGQITKPADQQTVQMHLLGWAPSYLDAGQQMVQFDTADNPPKGLATSYFSNQQVDNLVNQASSEVNPDKRKDLYCQAEKMVWDEAPWIFLWVQNFPIVYSARFTGVSSLPIEKFDAVYARPAK